MGTCASSRRTRSLAFAIALAAAGAAAEGQQGQGADDRAPEGRFVVPRTPDGRPDLQGYWTNATYTPLERPEGVTKAFYTPEEFAAIQQQREAREFEETEPGTAADVHYDFTQFALRRSQAPLAANLRTSLIVDPPDGRIPPMTPEGRQRNAELAARRKAMGAPTDAVQNMSNGARCLIMGGAGPPLMDAGYNANYQIVQSPGHVMILTEMIHDARIIPLDPRPEPPAAVREWMGISRGRWEGDTLVVETTNFNGRNPFRGSSENLRVVERFTRVGDDAIQYRFTVEDPSTWSRPWTAEERLQRTDGPIFEHACHEGNYGIANTLAGARAEEKRASEAAAGEAR